MIAKKKIAKMIVPIVLVLMGGGIGFLAARLGVQAAATIPANAAIWLLILFIPSFFLVIGFHELGHVLAGIKMNFDFRMYVVGPFLWDKEQDGWKFKWNKNVNISGGLVICLPNGTEHLSRRFSVYALAGPVASFILTSLAYVIYYLLQQVASTGVMLTVSYLFAMISFLSLMIFVVTIIPIHIGGFSSDGARVFRFLRGGEVAHFEILLLKIIGQSTSGTRPKFLNCQDVEEGMELAKKINAPMGIYLHAFAHQIAFDLGDIELAEKHLKNYLDGADEIPEGMRSAVWMDAAFFYAYAKNDMTEATRYWSKFKPSAILPKAHVFATEAVLARLNGDKDLMCTKIEASKKELPNMIDRGLALALREKLEKLQTAA